MMSDATGSDAEDLPEDKISYADEESDKESGREAEDVKKVEEIPDSLNPNDFPPKPFLSKKCTVPEDILVFHHSFGYDCQRHFNMVLLEEEILAFASGNLIHIFNVVTKDLQFRRSAGGGGIGHMTKNPNPLYQHLAVAERGENPLIIIYEWPSFNIVRLLKHGAVKTYSHINYSPDGEMLCSQGGEPDYLLTVWNWKASKIISSHQSNTNDVYSSAFSLFDPDHITACGANHIMFWKMASTFTGLKLMGSLGKFGRTEISDIIGCLALPDGKVISGCDWGNMLLWEEGLIKVEVSRKQRKQCHTAPITQLELQNGDLITVGLDGFVKMWCFDTIDRADPPEDNRFVELEPMMELQVKNDDNQAALMCVVKISQDPEDTFWYGQDANGGIWKFDLNLKSSIRQPPEQLLICHAGPVIDMAASPVDEHLATLGKDGRLFIYNYIKKKLLVVKRFPAEGSCLLWLPLDVDKTGTVLVAAFKDGVVRVVVISLEEMKEDPTSNKEFVTIIQTSKPHAKPITAMSLNDKGTVLVTGSEDSTIFVYHITESDKNVSLVPIGFVTVPNVVTFLSWKPYMATTLLVCCTAGTCVEVTLPEYSQSGTDVSYHLKRTTTTMLTVKYCKSHTRRNTKLEETQEPHSKSEEGMETLFCPEVPNPILFGLYTPKDTIWLSIAGYGAGYMNEFVMNKEEPVKYTVIASADDIEIYSYLYNHNKKYLMLGMQNGQIRVNRVNPNDHSDLSDFWLYSNHDNTNGRIRHLCFNYDHHFMFSCGDDGNIFSYHVNFDEEGDYNIPCRTPIASLGIPTKEKVEDIEDIKHLSLEETKAKAEYDKRMAVANQRKQKVLDRLEELKLSFRDIMCRNMKLPESQQIPMCDLEVHPDITKDLDDALQKEIDLVKQKFSFDVEKSRLGLQKLEDYFTNVLDSMTIYVCSIRAHEIHVAKTAPTEPEKRIPVREPFLTAAPEYKTSKKLQQLIEKYLQRKRRQKQRQQQWDLFLKEKPDETKNHPDDIAAIAEAEQTIGDYKLKSAADYRVPKHLRISKAKKYYQLLEARERLFMIKHNFNNKVYDLRNKKTALIERFNELNATLKNIHRELDPTQRKFLSEIPKFDEKLEFPEREFKLTEEDKEALLLQKLESSDSDTPMINHGADDTESVDAEYEALIGSYYPMTKEGTLEKTISTSYFANGSNVSAEQLEALTIEDNVDTAWETELKEHRMKRKLFEQDQMMNEMEKRIEVFDTEVEDLSHLKLRVNVEAKFLELNLLTLQQELTVLKDFEDVDEEVSNKVLNSLQDKHDMERKINDLQKLIQIKEIEINDLLYRERELTEKFQAATTNDSKFADFLRKTYNKKYKLQKAGSTRDSESSSFSSPSSSSSSDSDDEAASLDQQQLDLITSDKGVCPDGWEQDLYNVTLVLRSQRHDCEQELIKLRKQVENLKKDLAVNLKKIKTVETTLQTNQEEFEILQRKKQHKLNETECVVILKLSQMQHFKTGTYNMEKLSNTLVFSHERLQKLYSRVGELKKETQSQVDKYVKNRKHLDRLRVDGQHLLETIQKLKADIKECMLRKFGEEIDLDEMEESVLRRLVAEEKSPVKDLIKAYERRIHDMQEKLHKKQENLSRYMQENTEKLHLLTLLEEETHHFEKLQKLQTFKLEDAADEKANAYISDIEKLTEIMKHQALEIEILKNEIKMLRMKSKPLPPILGSATTAIPEEGSAHESREPLLSVPEELSVEEEEEAEDMDPTGIRGILKELTQSILKETKYTSLVQPEVSGVEQILSEIIDNLSSTEPSTNDITTVQEIFDEFKQQSESTTDLVSRTRSLVHGIIGGVTAAAPSAVTSHVQNIIDDIIDEVHDSIGTEMSVHPTEYILSDIVDKITSRQPTEEDSDGTQEILQNVVQQLQSSQVILDPISALQQIICDAINNLQATRLSKNGKDIDVKKVLDGIIDKLAAEECTDDIRIIIRELIDVISYKRLNLAESDTTEDIIDNVVTEIENRGVSKEDIAQVKEILQKAVSISVCEYGTEMISDGKEISDSSKTVLNTRDTNDTPSETKFEEE